jgi:hypothetical protein
MTLLGSLVELFKAPAKGFVHKSFRLSSRLRRKRSKAAATSSSSVKVVLMHLSIRIMMSRCQHFIETVKDGKVAGEKVGKKCGIRLGRSQ